MIIVAGWLEVDRATCDRYVADCVPVVEQARTASGCLDFAITSDPMEPDRVRVYERWESEAHLHQFRGSGPATAPRLVYTMAWAACLLLGLRGLGTVQALVAPPDDATALTRLVDPFFLLGGLLFGLVARGSARSSAR